MKILHICNDFGYSKVHANLYRELDALGVEQTVFTFYGGEDRTGRNRFEAERTRFVYQNVLKPFHRFFFHEKINTVYHSLKQTIHPEEYDLSHAISIFTNGPLSYKLYREYDVPYVVAVRNTDINTFLSIAPHTWFLGLNVLLNAKRIVFISQALMDSFCKHPLIKLVLNRIKNKFILQPNGIDDYWIDHVERGKKPDNHNLIYVGRFDTNKNVSRLLKAVLSLREKFPDIQMHLVGGGDTRHEEIMKIVNSNPGVFHYHGKITEKEHLRSMYQQCSVFAMTSFYETFGLVYLEALSQNLALVYTQHQGIDGLLDSRVGERVRAFSQNSIANAIERIFNDRNDYLAHEVVDFESFRWGRIAKRYYEMYEGIVNCWGEGQ